MSCGEADGAGVLWDAMGIPKLSVSLDLSSRSDLKVGARVLLVVAQRELKNPQRVDRTPRKRWGRGSANKKLLLLRQQWERSEKGGEGRWFKLLRREGNISMSTHHQEFDKKRNAP
jgi:hypothetical protein